MSQRIKQAEPAEPAAGREDGKPPARLAVGWRVALAVWALGFAGLVLYELWDFLWKGVRGLF